MIAEQEIVGRGAVEGARLMRDWFARLDAAAERKEAAAYVFVMGSLAEILRAFDMHLVFPEINSLQTAVRHVAHEYLGMAEDVAQIRRNREERRKKMMMQKPG